MLWYHSKGIDFIQKLRTTIRVGVDAHPLRPPKVQIGPIIGGLMQCADRGAARLSV